MKSEFESPDLNRRNFLKIALFAGLGAILSSSKPGAASGEHDAYFESYGVSMFAPILRESVTIPRQSAARQEVKAATETRELAVVYSVWIDQKSTTANLLIEKSGEKSAREFIYTSRPVNEIQIGELKMSEFAVYEIKAHPGRTQAISKLIFPKNHFQLKNEYVNAIITDGNKKGIVAAKVTRVLADGAFLVYYRNADGSEITESVNESQIYPTNRLLTKIRAGGIEFDELFLSESAKKLKDSKPEKYAALVKKAEAVFRGEKTPDRQLLEINFGQDMDNQEISQAVNEMTREFILNQIIKAAPN